MQTLVEKVNRYLLIATDWRGHDKKYLWFCNECGTLCVSSWHDVMTKKQQLACCYTLTKYGKIIKFTTQDTIARYASYKVEGAIDYANT